MNITIERGRPMGRNAFWRWYAVTAVMAGLIGLFAAQAAIDNADNPDAKARLACEMSNDPYDGVTPDCSDVQAPEPVYLVER